jgi:hypothetical protein
VRRGRDLGIMGDGSADGLDGLEGSVVVGKVGGGQGSRRLSSKFIINIIL